MDVFDLYAKIGLDKSEYESGLKDAQSKMSTLAKNVGNGLKTVAKVGATAIAAGAAGVAALTKMGVEGYKEYEQLVGGVETLFKTSQNVVMKYAENAYKTAGMSANEYMSTVTSFSASLIQSLGGDTAKAAEVGNMAITDMSDNANKMGTSMEMIQNAYNGFAKQNYTMLDNLKLGYGGTKEEMQRLLTDAEKISGIKYDISSFADVTEAIHVMQVEMGIAGTTAREAATTIEGSISMMKGSWQNLIVGMADGNANMDVLINNFVDSTAQAAQNLLPRIEQTLLGIGSLIEKLAPVIGEALPKLIASVLPSLLSAGVSLISSLVSGIITAAPAIYEALMTALYTTLTSVFGMSEEKASGFVGNLDGLFRSAFSAIETVFNALYQLVSTIFGTIGEVAGNLGITWDKVFAGIQFAIEFCANAISIAAEFISNAIKWLVTEAQTDGSFINNVFNGIKDTVDFLWNACVIAFEAITAAWKWVAEQFNSNGVTINSIFTEIKNIIGGVWNFCVNAFESIRAAFQNAVKQINTEGTFLNKVFTGVKEIISGVIEFLVALWENMKERATKLFQDLSAAFSWVAEQMNTDGTLINTIWENIKSYIKSAIDFIKGVIDLFISVLKGDWKAAWEAVKKIASAAWDAICAVFDSAWEIIKSIFSVVASWFNNKVIQPVKNFFTGMWDGVKNGAKNAWNGITSVFSNVTNWFRDKFTEAWTAVKNVFSTGGKVFDGITEGIVSTFKTVVNAIIGGINKVVAVPFNAINSILKKLKKIELVGIKPFDWVTTFSVPEIPKLSTGLNYVPYDEYPAFLHRGEAVLTAAQAQSWRNGGTALTGNGQIMSVLFAILNAITGGNAELIEAVLADKTFSVSGREFGRLVKEYA